MVARAADCYILALRCIDSFDQRFCNSPIHLYAILMNREKALETIVVLSLACLLGSLWLDASWFVYFSIGLLVISLIFRKLTYWIGKGWFSFSYYLGLIMNYIIMFVIFYLFLVPLAFLQRLTRSNQILRKKEGNTYFQRRDHLFSSKDIERPW